MGEHVHQHDGQSQAEGTADDNEGVFQGNARRAVRVGDTNGLFLQEMVKKRRNFSFDCVHGEATSKNQ